MSAPRRGGLECCCYDAHDHAVDGSTPTHVSLLRPWIRCFAIIISVCWNLTSSKLHKSKAKTEPEHFETNVTPKRV